MTNIDDDIEALTPDDLDSLKESLSSEGKRIGTLETMVSTFIRSKMEVAPDGKTVKLTMSSKEIRDITAAQKDLFDMRRKNSGRQD